jgi:hypothetical protein
VIKSGTRLLTEGLQVRVSPGEASFLGLAANPKNEFGSDKGHGSLLNRDRLPLPGRLDAGGFFRSVRLLVDERHQPLLNPPLAMSRKFRRR